MQIEAGIPGSATNGHGSTAAHESALAREFHDVLIDIEDLVKSATSLSGEELARARAKLNARMTAAKESVQRVGDATAGRVRDSARATDSYVHTHPWQAIGVASVVGVLLGFVLSRRG
jgi:ElaB/YqjD/DUF883 family membrane-anchored ribosome-binding protein